MTAQKTIPNFSENALTILTERYLQPGESPKEMLERVSFGNSDYYELMARGDFLPNSPTLFNGGITDDNGEPIGTLSACFKFDVPDSLEGIMDTAKKAALVQKWGGGVGYALSELRPKGAPVRTTNRVAGGPIAFLRLYNAVALAWTQGGKRDGAQMGILDCDHPDIREFIHCKDTINEIEALARRYDESGNKAVAADLRRGLLTTFNISVALTDKFMQQAEISGTPQYDLLWEMAESAWKTGDPGCYFRDTAELTNPTKWLGRLTATNPCGEVPLIADEPCNLGSINLGNFVTDESPEHPAGEVDWHRLEEAARVATRFLDTILDNNTFPHEDIDRIARLTRKLGLGVMGWADMLALMHIHYDTDRAVLLGQEIMEFISLIAYGESVKLAREKGPAPAYYTNGPADWPESERTAPYNCDSNSDLFYSKHELPRNVTRTCIAPTGTISILLDASSGIEPHYSFEWRRKTDASPTGYLIERAAVLDRCAPFVPKTAREIDWIWHVRHQAAFQAHTDLAVSKTINMPNNATPADVHDAYIEMWRLGCKGGTIFRDGSRTAVLADTDNTKPVEIAQPSENVQIVTVAPPAANPTHRRRLQDERQSVTHKFRVGEQEGYATVGLFPDGQPGELFVTISKEGSTVRGLFETIGILTSMCLQHGVPLDTLTKKLQGITFEPAGFTSNKLIPQASSLVDYLFHWIRHRFMPETLVESPGAEPEIVDGLICPQCGSRVISSEGCLTCSARCGWTRCG